MPPYWETLCSERLTQAEMFLKEQQSLSPRLAFIASYTIIVREGMEAILLLAIIFSVLSGLKGTTSKMDPHQLGFGLGCGCPHLAGCRRNHYRSYAGRHGRLGKSRCRGSFDLC